MKSPLGPLVATILIVLVLAPVRASACGFDIGEGVQDLCTELRNFVKNHPDDHQGHYALALALELSSREITHVNRWSRREDGLRLPTLIYGQDSHFPQPACLLDSLFFFTEFDGSTPRSIYSCPVLKGPHLEAIAEYRKAIALVKPDDPTTLAYYRYCLAMALENGALAADAWQTLPDGSTPPPSPALNNAQADRVRAWIANLDSPSFDTREHAEQQLRLHIDQALPLLKKASYSTSPEAAYRVDRILATRFRTAWSAAALTAHREALSAWPSVLPQTPASPPRDSDADATPPRRAAPDRRMILDGAAAGEGGIEEIPAYGCDQWLANKPPPDLKPLDRTRILAEASAGVVRLLDSNNLPSIDPAALQSARRTAATADDQFRACAKTLPSPQGIIDWNLNGTPHVIANVNGVGANFANAKEIRIIVDTDVGTVPLDTIENVGTVEALNK